MEAVTDGMPVPGSFLPAAPYFQARFLREILYFHYKVQTYPPHPFCFPVDEIIIYKIWKFIISKKLRT